VPWVPSVAAAELDGGLLKFLFEAIGTSFPSPDYTQVVIVVDLHLPHFPHLAAVELLQVGDPPPAQHTAKKCWRD
jgi:hypothetical protein